MGGHILYVCVLFRNPRLVAHHWPFIHRTRWLVLTQQLQEPQQIYLFIYFSQAPRQKLVCHSHIYQSPTTPPWWAYTLFKLKRWTQINAQLCKVSHLITKVLLNEWNNMLWWITRATKSWRGHKRHRRCYIYRICKYSSATAAWFTRISIEDDLASCNIHLSVRDKPFAMLQPLTSSVMNRSLRGQRDEQWAESVCRAPLMDIFLSGRDAGHIKRVWVEMAD